MHGGLFSQDNITLADIKATERDKQPPEEGIMCELLWSDPQPSFGRAPSKRGVGCQFGPDVTRRFLENNNLEYIIRSHEVKVGRRTRAEGTSELFLWGRSCGGMMLKNSRQNKGF